MKICPICGKVLSYNSYFGGYICTECKWEDASIGKKRNKGTATYKMHIIKESRSVTFRGFVTTKERSK